MSNAYEYQLNETTRFTAQYEDTYLNPLDSVIGDDIGIFILRPEDKYTFDDVRSEHYGALDHFRLAFNHYTQSNYVELREEAISRYLGLFGLRSLFTTLRGYSQSEWADVVIYARSEDSNAYLEDSLKDIQRWFRGDMFTINHEEAKEFVAEDGERLTIWRTVDSIGGCFVDSNEDLYEMAQATFTF